MQKRVIRRIPNAMRCIIHGVPLFLNSAELFSLLMPRSHSRRKINELQFASSKVSGVHIFFSVLFLSASHVRGDFFLLFFSYFRVKIENRRGP